MTASHPAFSAKKAGCSRPRPQRTPIPVRQRTRPTSHSARPLVGSQLERLGYHPGPESVGPNHESPVHLASEAVAVDVVGVGERCVNDPEYSAEVSRRTYSLTVPNSAVGVEQVLRQLLLG